MSQGQRKDHGAVTRAFAPAYLTVKPMNSWSESDSLQLTGNRIGQVVSMT